MNKGFTLIELIIVASIILLISGGVLTNYNSYNETQRLKQAAITLKSHLRLAQAKALSGAKPGINCTTFVGYRVTFTGSSYSYTPQCSNRTVDEQRSTYTLPTGVTFAAVPPSFDLSVLTGSSTVATNLTLTSMSRTYVLAVSVSGDITDEGLQ